MIDPDEMDRKARFQAELSARTDRNGYISPKATAEAKRAAGVADAEPPPPEPGAGPGDGGARVEPPADRNLYREIRDAEQAGDWARSLALKGELLSRRPADPVESAQQRIAAETTPAAQD